MNGHVIVAADRRALAAHPAFADLAIAGLAVGAPDATLQHMSA